VGHGKHVGGGVSTSALIPPLGPTYLRNVIKIRKSIDKFLPITYLLAFIFRIFLNHCLYFNIKVEVNDASSTDVGNHPGLVAYLVSYGFAHAQGFSPHA
jgi:hypothetical protein